MGKSVKIEGRGSLGGVVWFIGWLFTIGFLKLNFWKGLLALIVWPYFLGAHFSDSLPSAEVRIEQAGGEMKAGPSPDRNL